MLTAHGLDEGGEPDKGIGGHDVMWFVVRDLVFGPAAHPDVDPPGAIARPEADAKTPGRRMPQIDLPYEMLLGFLMNLLIIEFRAEIGFAGTQAILRTPTLFTDRRTEAELAAMIVERIRTDEAIHVESLRLYVGELRGLTLNTVDGGTVPGAELIDPFWAGLVRWATVDQPRMVAENTHLALRKQILETDDGERILGEFDALADPGYSLAAG